MEGGRRGNIDYRNLQPVWGGGRQMCVGVGGATGVRLGQGRVRCALGVGGVRGCPREVGGVEPFRVGGRQVSTSEPNMNNLKRFQYVYLKSQGQNLGSTVSRVPDSHGQGQRGRRWSGYWSLQSTPASRRDVNRSSKSGPNRRLRAARGLWSSESRGSAQRGLGVRVQGQLADKNTPPPLRVLGIGLL